MAHIPRVTWSENGDQPWNAECLDTNCHWSACGEGGLYAALAAHRLHGDSTREGA